jgi:(heptosyl)LPS beta-1,4-glucosyltransferase
MNKTSITAVVIAQNEAEMIGACLDTLSWCSELLVIDNGSTDATAKIAKSRGAQVVSSSANSFAMLRNEALKHINTEWILYIDADERVSPALAKEILKEMLAKTATVFALIRTNVFFGKKFSYGGWQNDMVERIFKVAELKEWIGIVHETPKFSGTVGVLQNKLIHLTHRDIRSGLFKSASWTYREAGLLYSAGIPRVKILTMIRKAVMEFLRRVVFNKGYKDGEAGIVEGCIQAINKFLIYAQVWELQQIPSIRERYQQEEQKIVELWKNEKSI